jgi:hypothetical protein
MLVSRSWSTEGASVHLVASAGDGYPATPRKRVRKGRRNEAMEHAKGKIERAQHYCKCGCSYSNVPDLEQHISAWADAAESNRLQREIADKAKRMAPNLSFTRDNKRR